MSHHADDVAAALARLATPAAANPPTPADEPSLPEAVARWVEAKGWRRGAYPTPGARVLLEAFRRWADSRGWSVQAGPLQLARVLDGHFRRCGRRDRQSWLLRKEDADALWLLAPECGWLGPRPQPLNGPPSDGARKCRRRRADRGRPFHPLHRYASPLVDVAGRVYPTAREAARLLGCGVDAVRDAVRAGRALKGRNLRRMAPEEVALVPLETLAGDVVAALGWFGTVSVRPLPERARLAAAGRVGGAGWFPSAGGPRAGGGPLSHIFSETGCPTCGRAMQAEGAKTPTGL